MSPYNPNASNPEASNSGVSDSSTEQLLEKILRAVQNIEKAVTTTSPAPAHNLTAQDTLKIHLYAYELSHGFALPYDNYVPQVISHFPDYALTRDQVIEFTKPGYAIKHANYDQTEL